MRRKVSRKARKGATAQRNTAAITAPPLSPREIVFHAKPAEEQRRKEIPLRSLRRRFRREKLCFAQSPQRSNGAKKYRCDHCTAAFAARNCVSRKAAEEQRRKEIPLRSLHRCYRCGKLYFNK